MKLDLFHYLFLYLLSFSIGIIIVMFLRQRKSQIEQKDQDLYLKSLEERLDSIQLNSINFKLNPHLFKNILNSIQSHAYQTYHAMDKLTNVLDYILYESDKKFVSLKEEISFCMSLIEINRLKVSPLMDFNVKKKINEENSLFYQNLIAPLITVHLVENAFKHTNLLNPHAFISIIFELKDNVFSLTVSNSISSRPGIKKENSGFGGESLRKRLDIIYGDCFQLEQKILNDTFYAYLKINLVEHKFKMRTVG